MIASAAASTGNLAMAALLPMAMVVLLTGCEPPMQQSGHTRTGLQQGLMAPEIVGQTIDGSTMKLSDLRGKVVILEFWASW